jgi:hypothetical protein
MAERVFTDSTGRVKVHRVHRKTRSKDRWLWSLTVDGAWLGSFGGGLPSVANYAHAYTRLGIKPTLDEATILRELSEDLAIKGIEEAQR